MLRDRISQRQQAQNNQRGKFYTILTRCVEINNNFNERKRRNSAIKIDKISGKHWTGRVLNHQASLLSHDEAMTSCQGHIWGSLRKKRHKTKLPRKRRIESACSLLMIQKQITQVAFTDMAGFNHACSSNTSSFKINMDYCSTRGWSWL